MSKSVKNTHRRQMRTVTPIVRSRRFAAGAAVAMGMMATGGSVATADSGADAAPQAEGPASSVIPAASADAVAIPGAQSLAAEGTDTALAPTAGAISVAAPEVLEDDEQDSSETRSEESRSSRSSENRSEDSRSSRSSTRSDRGDDSDDERDGADKKSSSRQKDSEESSSTGGARGSSIVSTARNQLGSRYVLGASSPGRGFDCSGLVHWVYAQHGISTPRTSGQIASAGRWIPRSEARPGDIVVWSGHVGIYAGDGKVIDASGSRRVVMERAIWGSPKGFVTYR